MKKGNLFLERLARIFVEQASGAYKKVDVWQRPPVYTVPHSTVFYSKVQYIWRSIPVIGIATPYVMGLY